MDPVRQIADAVLYEGYVLWPYRRSAMKNRRRWTFGGVFPRQWSAEHPDDAWEMRTECLVQGSTDAAVDVRVRFLHVVGRLACEAGEDGLRPVDELTVAGERHLSWEEATEREIEIPHLTLAELTAPRRVALDIPAGREEEELRDRAGERAGALVRRWEGLRGEVEISARPVGPALHALSVHIVNATPWDGGSREEVLRLAFCSTHTALNARGAEFVSLTDPPDELREAAAGCRNQGTWPVLVGEPGERRMVLSSPIILEDHPRVAPESPGDLFDGGEIDQLLVLNILALSDEEKREMRDSDPRTREILERTEALTPEELMRLHGTMRDVRVVRET